MRPVHGLHIGIYNRRHMQHHIVVGRVLVVLMQHPVGRAFVYLHIAHPQRTADAQLGIKKVGACMCVVQSRVNHLHRASVGSVHLVQWQYAVFPNVME